MKILLATFLYDTSGGGVYATVKSLGRALKERGLEVVILATAPVTDIRVEWVDGIKVYRLPPNNLYWIGHKDRQPAWKKALWHLMDFWNPFTYAQVRTILTNEQPDIVHIQKLRGLSGAIWSAAKKNDSTRLVHTCQDYEVLSPEGTFSGRVGQFALRHPKLAGPYTWFRARLSRLVDAATAPSRYVLDLHTQRGFFPAAHRRVVHNTHGFSSQELAQLRAAPRPRNQAVRLLYIGRLEKEKGLITLCRAFEKATDSGANLHLDIAGSGSLADYLQQQWGNHPRIRLLGPVYGEAKRQHFIASDAMVLASECPDSSPVSITEAYAYGVPVVASAMGGIPELVLQGETGFLAPAGDTVRFADLFSELAGEPGRLLAMRPKCLNRAAEYALEAVTSQYESVYLEVLHNNRLKQVQEP